MCVCVAYNDTSFLLRCCIVHQLLIIKPHLFHNFFFFNKINILRYYKYYIERRGSTAAISLMTCGSLSLSLMRWRAIPSSGAFSIMQMCRKHLRIQSNRAHVVCGSLCAKERGPMGIFVYMYVCIVCTCGGGESIRRHVNSRATRERKACFKLQPKGSGLESQIGVVHIVPKVSPRRDEMHSLSLFSVRCSVPMQFLSPFLLYII